MRDEEMRTTLSLFLTRRRGILGWFCGGLGRVLGCCWAGAAGLLGGLLHGLHGQVRSVKSFSIFFCFLFSFLFSVLQFCFEFKFDLIIILQVLFM
jgi:hypothetical protein